MRKLMVACGVAVVLVSCDTKSSDHAQPTQATTSPAPPAVAPEQPEEPGDAPLKACADADDAAGAQWQRVISGQKVNGSFTDGKFHDALAKMISTCRPILPAFVVDQSDTRRAKLAKECQLGYRLKIQAYQDMIDGVADSKTAETLISGAEKINDCAAGASKIDASEKDGNANGGEAGAN